MKANNAVIILLFIILSAIIGFALLYTPPPPATQPTPTSITIPDYLTATPSNINWGNVTGPTTRNVNITSTADVNFTLTMTSDCTVGTLTWNLENTTLPAHQTATATFTLYPNWNAPVGPFTFDINVKGTET
jgi:hypothetical protein